MAVTIDDLPFAGPPRPGDTVDRATARLLGHASAAAAPVTGFVNCDRLDGHASVVREWLSAGATLGNHTAGHMSLDAEEPGGWRAHVGSCRRRLEVLVGRPPRWFRYPYLQRGATPSRRAEGARVLLELGHEVAPVTIDTSDWALATAYVAALRAGDTRRAQQVVEAFLDHVRAATRRYRTIARRRVGREVAQVLLLHANALVADHLGELLAALREQGARFVTLDEAMEDPVYAMPDTYVGPVGLSWLLRIGPEPERAWRWDHAQLEGIEARFTEKVAPRDAHVGTDLRWRTLTDGAWVVTHEGIFDAHSLVVEVADGTLVLADTPPTGAATTELLDWLRARFGRRPLVAIDGHFHLDATGGNAAIRAVGGRVVASDLTARLLAAHGASGREALAAMARDAGNDALAARFAETAIGAPTETFPLVEGRTFSFGGERVKVVH
ncbi:MAG TPA: polysaccharide deacetylase family protein, partial [Polyangiaceae bacterium LLY-WYZ-14_1]|nr:polysaccharide deacetylase family protein [Polyangiaceae bacterium LLY-WYZ-14_1]